MCRPSRIRKMLASRACRTSVNKYVYLHIFLKTLFFNLMNKIRNTLIIDYDRKSFDGPKNEKID